jgi:hypothetical protein
MIAVSPFLAPMSKSLRFFPESPQEMAVSGIFFCDE